MERGISDSVENDFPRNSLSFSEESNMSTAYDRGVRDSTLRLRELVNQQLVEGSAYTESAPDSFLPGISENDQPSRAPPSPPDATRHKTLDRFRPALSRSHSANEEPVSPARVENSRPRNHTITDIPDSPSRNKQPNGVLYTKDDHQNAKPGDSRGKSASWYPSDVRQGTSSDLPVSRGSPSQDQAVQKSRLLGSKVTPPHSSFIAHLMNRTRGQIQGILFFRQDPDPNWTRAYCLLSAATGSLLRDSDAAGSASSKLIEDLRGCKVQAAHDPLTLERTLHVATRGQKHAYQLRPADASEFDAWFAALVCWQAARRTKSLELDLSDSQLTPVSISTRREKKRLKEVKGASRESSIVKVAKLAMWNRDNVSEPVSREFRVTSNHRRASGQPSNWGKVSCMLHEGGEFRVMNTADVRELAMIPLSKLPRSAVQRLCPSVLKCENVIAIFPHYSSEIQSQPRLQPLYLRCESRPQHELWFVLLRAFTVPELYGPSRNKAADSLRSHEALPGLAQGSISSLFRVERSLSLHIGEYRTGLSTDLMAAEEGEVGTDKFESPLRSPPEYFAQVLVDGIVRAKTRAKPGPNDVAWFENLDVLELPPTASFITIQIRRLSIVSASKVGDVQPSTANLAAVGSLTEDSNVNNELIAEVIAPLNSSSIDADKRLTMIDDKGETSKILSLKMRLNRHIVLADQEYSALSELLHDFSNIVTLQMAELVPSDLPRLSENLLNIFQVSGSSKDWLTSLAEEEIDGIRKEVPRGRFHYNSRLDSNDSKEALPAQERADFTRDMTRATIAEANLLFRGNTLLSKGLDAHMQRLGREYLEETLGSKLREIAELDQDVEVDPAKLSATASLHFNWLRLHDLVRSVWSLIRKSAPKCPPELRSIFRHIKACTEEKYGHCLKTVPYSSVSGFLFLRFFCPAMLNPILFDLVNDFPRPRALRGFVLIAKTLQGLANQSTFGSKEPWMEPMNHFLNKHKADFRDFIDEICIFAPIGPPSASSQYYSAALSTFSRLPTICKEGYLSLPFLIDETRAFAALVDMWLENISYQPSNQPLDSELLQFHNECLNLRKKTQELFRRAERGAQRSGNLEEKWNALVQLMHSKPQDFWTGYPQQLEFDKSDVEHEMLIPSGHGFENKRSEAENSAQRLETAASLMLPQTTEAQRTGRQASATERFSSRSRSRTASPLRTGEYDSTASGSQDDVAAVPLESGKLKKKSKDKQRHGLFGRRKKSEK